MASSCEEQPYVLHYRQLQLFNGCSIYVIRETNALANKLLECIYLKPKTILLIKNKTITIDGNLVIHEKC